MPAWLKILVGGLVGGIIPVATVVGTTFSTVRWDQQLGNLGIVYGISALASAALLWMKSPRGREIWTEEKREAERQKVEEHP